MSLELSGTTGVKGVAGSVSAPSIVGDDTNTGISFPSADTIKFSTGGVERMQITNSGVTGTGIGAGKILQVIQGSTSSEITTSSTTYVDSGLSQAITTTGSNKVLVITNQQFRVYRNSTQALGGFRLMRDSTVLDQGPNGDSGRDPFGVGIINNSSDNHLYGRHVQTYLDAPSAGTHTYKTQMALTTLQNSATIRAQYNASNGEDGTSFIILMEVSA